MNNKDFVAKLDADIATMERNMQKEILTPLQRQVHTFEDATHEMSQEELLSYCDNNL